MTEPTPGSGASGDGDADPTTPLPGGASSSGASSVPPPPSPPPPGPSAGPSAGGSFVPAPPPPSAGPGAAGGPAASPWAPPGATPIGLDAPAPRRRSRGALVGAIVGVVALLAAGVFAITKIAGSDDDGGAASPTDVGNELVAALNEEDVLGIIDLLLPSEQDALRQPLLDVIDDLKRLEVLSDDATLEQIGGVDLQFDDVTVDEEPTNADDITNIVLSGTSTATINGEEVPLGDLLIDSAFDGERPEMDQPAQTNEFDDVQLTTVERDGRWYLSAFYTIAEQARGDEDIPPAPEEAPEGAAAPDDAVDGMINALAEFDLEAAIGLLDPNEAEALQRYAPLFLDEAGQAAQDAGVVIEVADTEYTVDGQGDRRNVGIDSISMTITDQESGSLASFTYADGCLEATGMTEDEEPMRVCGTDYEQIGTMLGGTGFVDPDALEDLLAAYSDAFDDFDAAGVAVHKVGDSWYVSPLRSMLDGYNSVFDALERDEIERIIDASSDLLTQTMEGQVVTECTFSTDEDGCEEDTATDGTAGDNTATEDTVVEDTVADG